MVKRVLMLGVAALALAVFAPALVDHSMSGQAAAQAPEAPDDADEPEQPEAPDQGDNTDDDDEGNSDEENDDDDDEDEEDEGGRPQNAAPTPGGSHGKGSHGNTGSGGGPGSGVVHAVAPSPTVGENVGNLSAGTDTGTIPQGGVQAGAGGTADSGTDLALLLSSGALMLVLTAGGLALRRRDLEL